MKTLSFRERFEESYMPVRIPAKNAKGYKTKYIYYAPWYIWDISAVSLKKEKTLLLVNSILSLVLFLWVVTRDTKCNYNIFVYAPAVLAFCIHILELAALVRFACSSTKITKMIYYEVTEVMQYVPAGRGFLCAISGLVSLIHVFTDNPSTIALCVVAGYMIYAGIAWFVFYRFSRLTCRIEDNNVVSCIIDNRKDV